MPLETLKIRDLAARPVNVPMLRPLETSGGSVTTAPLVLIDLATEEGVVGRSYIFCYTPAVLAAMIRLFESLAEAIVGDPVAPTEIEEKLQRRFRLIGAQGLAGMAIAGLDMAAWDALARAVELPLVRLLGAAPTPIPAYNSNGLGIIGPERAGPEAEELVAAGFGAIKLRLGYADAGADIAAVRAVRSAVGDDILLMSDFNQSLSVPEAQRRIRALDNERLYWIEEPVRADDYAGCARIRVKARTPIQLGENAWGPHDMAKAIAAGAGDLFMPDAMKIGGVTGWQRAAALGEAEGLPISSHLFPEISAHLLAATPTRHWLEYVDWANPILKEPVQVADGHVTASAAPGIGLEWDDAAVDRYTP